MRWRDREYLRRRFDFRCGYCGVTEENAGTELTLDHFQPISQGGTDVRANWVYACFTCNNLKRDVWAPDSPERILHPFNDDLSFHIAMGPDARLIGLTPTGQYHIEQLQLNRAPLVLYRQARVRELEREHALEAIRREQEEQREAIRTLERRIAEAERQLRSE